MKKILLLSTGFFLLQTALNAQTEYSSFTNTGRGASTTFATDYQTVGINPSNLGWGNPYGKKMTMGFTEMTYSVYSQALSKQELRDNMWGAIRGDSASNFTKQQKIDAAQSFTGAGFAINADIGSFGFSYQHEKIGGFAFRINDRFQWYSKLGKQASEILFLGFNAPYFDSLKYNNGTDTVTIANYENMSQDSASNVLLGFRNTPQLLSQIMEGSIMQMSWTREYNLSYGRKIFGDSTFMLFGGVGIKYIQGMAYLDVNDANGQLNAFSSMSPGFKIDYGTAASSNPSTVTQSGNFPKPVGQGFGVDLGVNAVIKKVLKIGVAVTNIGSMTWDGNVYTVKDTTLHDTDNGGLNNYNIGQQIGTIAGKDGLFQWQGLTTRKINLPMTYRLGASLKIKEIANIGVDVIVPGNNQPGNFQGAVIGFGGDVTPTKWLRLSTGFVTGGNYDFRIPIGVTIIGGGGTWEGGVASRDLITFFAQNGPTLSLSMGFLRFRF